MPLNPMTDEERERIRARVAKEKRLSKKTYCAPKSKIFADVKGDGRRR